MIANISPQSFAQLINEGGAVDLIDVRTPREFRAVHAQGARNVPLEEVSTGCLNGARAFIICHSGTRAQQAAAKLAAAGCDNLTCIEGGTKAWEAAGLPVVRGRHVIPLDRQVRIGAGSMVLLGVILALTVHPWWIGLSAFVGAGLIFAGITDTCGLACVLAKMPWNR